MKTAAIVLGCVAGYLVIGGVVTVWTGARGEAGKPHFQADSAASAIALSVFAWPYVLAKNLTATAEAPPAEAKTT